MFKRLTWMGVGLVAGFGASKWVEHKARQRLARYIPGGRLTLEAGAELRDRARQAATGTLADLRSAVAEGRDAMAVRQAELRHQLRLVGTGPGRGGEEPKALAVHPVPEASARRDWERRPPLSSSKGGNWDELDATRARSRQASRTDRRH